MSWTNATSKEKKKPNSKNHLNKMLVGIQMWTLEYLYWCYFSLASSSSSSYTLLAKTCPGPPIFTRKKTHFSWRAVLRTLEGLCFYPHHTFLRLVNNVISSQLTAELGRGKVGGSSMGKPGQEHELGPHIPHMDLVQPLSSPALSRQLLGGESADSAGS